MADDEDGKSLSPLTTNPASSADGSPASFRTPTNELSMNSPFNVGKSFPILTSQGSFRSISSSSVSTPDLTPSSKTPRLR
jgi:hypothetical protein